MVTGRFGGTSLRTESPLSVLESTPTFTAANAGMYFDTGSASASLPLSMSIIAARLVIGLVIE